MTSEQAFRTIARRCLRDVTRHQDKTAAGDLVALHQMRISITRLRTAIAFFAPMTSDQEWRRLKREFKWLNSRLGAARDLDVMVEKSIEDNDGRAATARHKAALDKQWIGSHLRVAKALQSKRYRQLQAGVAAWIEHGPWSSAKDERSRQRRLAGISSHSARILARWQRDILTRSRTIAAMSPDKRHRLRIRTKRLRYAVEWFGRLVPSHSPDWQPAMLKQLRRAQNCLGELNDAEQTRAIAQRSGKRAAARWTSHDAKHEKRLLMAAEAAYQKLAKLGG